MAAYQCVKGFLTCLSRILTHFSKARVRKMRGQCTVTGREGFISNVAPHYKWKTIRVTIPVSLILLHCPFAQTTSLRPVVSAHQIQP